MCLSGSGDKLLGGDEMVQGSISCAKKVTAYQKTKNLSSLQMQRSVIKLVLSQTIWHGQNVKF